MTRSRWLVRGLLLFVLAFANLNDIRPEQTAGGEAPGLWSPDVLPNALFAWTLIKEHNVDYDEFVFPPTGGASKPAPEAVQAAKEKIDREAYFFRACGTSTATAPPTAKRSLGGPPAPGPNDHVCSVFPPGMGILALPFFAPFVLNGWNPLDLGLLVHGGHVVAAFVEILATLVLCSPLEQGYGIKSFATPIQTGLYGLLVSPSRGLLVYTPYVIFAFFALFRAWRWPGEVAGRLRGLSLVWIAALVLYSTYAEWWGGRVFGSRFMDDLAPILFVAIAWGTSVGMLGSRFARTVFGLLAAWSFVLFQAAAFLYDKAWDTVPVNVNDDPSRLFNWSDPQWLAVLRLVPSADERVLAGAVLSALVLVLLVRLELRAIRGSELASQV